MIFGSNNYVRIGHAMIFAVYIENAFLLIGVLLIEKCKVCICWTKSTRKYIIFVEFYRDLFTNGYTVVLISFTLQHSSLRNKVIY